MIAMVFDVQWDAGNRDKCRKHGVTPEEVEEVFVGAPSIFVDAQHSIDEQRWRAIGRTDAGRWVFVVFTLRDLDGLRLIRPISARYMHAKEIAHYAEAQAIARSHK